MLAGRVVVGRQAISDRELEVVAYELLFRASGDSTDSRGAHRLSPDQMTAEVVFGSLNIGLDLVSGGKTLFCNADRGVLIGDVPLALPPEQTVIEVLETVVPDQWVLAGCQELVDQGFRLALDDFVWFDAAPELLKLASIVKIDIQSVPGEDVLGLIERCRPYDVQLLAEKVETSDELEQCQELGFELFQGYLLERPVVISGATIEPGRITRMRMAASVLSGELEFDELDDLLHSDPGLAYQVMQLASIGRLGETARRINTVREALVIAGSRRMQNWMALLLALPERAVSDDGMTRTLIRARACELLASRVDASQAPVAFAAGLLSGLDLMLGVSAEELMRTLPLGDELAEAAFGDQTELARIVRDAEAYQLDTPDRHLRSDLDEADLDEAFSRAFGWTLDTEAALKA